MDYLNSNVEYEGDNDDIYYAELRRQILTLTSNSDDEEFQKNKRSDLVKINMPSKPAEILAGGRNFVWPEKESSQGSAPTWLLNLWRNSNGGSGTGVFIPHVVTNSRRRHKPRRKNRKTGRVYKPVE